MTSEFFEYLENNYKTSDYLRQNITAPTKNLAYEVIYGSNWPQWYRDNVFNSNFSCNNYSASNASILWWQEKEKKFQQSDFNNYDFPIDATGDMNFIDNFKNYVDSPSGNSIKFYWYDEGVQPSGKTFTGNPERSIDGVYEFDDIGGTGFRSDFEGNSNNYTEYTEKVSFYIPVGFDTWELDYTVDAACGTYDVSGDAYRNSCNLAIQKYGTISSGIPNGHEVFTNCLGAGDAEGAWNYLPYNYYVNYDSDLS